MSSSSVAPAVTSGLAEFVGTFHWDDVPAHVRHEAKRALLNYFAVALAGCNDPVVAKAERVYARFASGGEAGVIGRPARTDILHAASLNAMSANLFDFCDTHMPTIIHPTAPVAPPLFALAQQRLLSGSALLHAFILGVEVECRIGNAISPGHYARGWHITSTCGVFGAAAATGKVLGLDSQALAWALGNASSQASGLVETLGTSSKSFGVGSAAANGILSALLAQQGFDGPARALEGERGFLRVTAETPDMEGILAGLGQHWELMNNTYKPYPCGVVLNPVIEGCLALSAQRRWAADAIERIELTGHPLLRQRADRPGVRTGRESQVSAQHAVAVALATGRAGLEAFSDAAVADAALRPLGAKVRFIDDPAMGIDGVRIKIVMKQGAPVGRSTDAAQGCLANPLSDAQIEEKLRTLCRFGGSGCAPEPLIEAVWSLEQAADAGAVMALAAGVAGGA